MQLVDDKLSVSELMTTSLIALPPVVPVRRVVDVLRMCAHQAFPVTPQVDRALADSGAWCRCWCGVRGAGVRWVWIGVDGGRGKGGLVAAAAGAGAFGSAL